MPHAHVTAHCSVQKSYILLSINWFPPSILAFCGLKMAIVSSLWIDHKRAHPIFWEPHSDTVRHGLLLVLFLFGSDSSGNLLIWWCAAPVRLGSWDMARHHPYACNKSWDALVYLCVLRGLLNYSMLITLSTLEGLWVVKRYSGRSVVGSCWVWWSPREQMCPDTWLMVILYVVGQYIAVPSKV